MGRILLFVLLTLGLIALDWYRRRDWRKSLIALGTFLWIASLAMMGLTMRAILPLFLAHTVLLALAWLALLFYLYKERYLWWAFLLPAATLLLFVALNFFEGSRATRAELSDSILFKFFAISFILQ